MSALVGASSASALLVREIRSAQIQFAGRECGEKARDVIRVPSSARFVNLRYPQPGKALRRRDGVRRVAQFTGYRNRPRSILVKARGAFDVCRRPSAYEAGWRTRRVRAWIGYRIWRRVRFASYNLQRQIAPQVRPRTILFGAHSAILRMRWQRWGGRAASGRGTLEYNFCDPNCAAGNYGYYEVKVRLSRPARCSSRWRYKRLSFSYAGGRPQGVGRRYSQGFRC